MSNPNEATAMGPSMRRKRMNKQMKMKIEQVRRCLREMDVVQRDMVRRTIVIGTLLDE